jgi:hypothetical protein
LFEQKRLITIGELLEEIKYFFMVSASGNTMLDFLRGLLADKTVMGVLLERVHVIADSK